ncbi:MAG: DsbC family protein [Cellvibrionaceae bacterium]
MAIVLASFLSFVVDAQPLVKTATDNSNNQASSGGVPADIEKQIIERLKKARPELTFSDLSFSPMDGVYQIKINGQLAFVSGDGGYLIAGEMYEVQEGNLVNLQEQERQEAELAFAPQRAKMIAAIDKSDMVIYKPKGEVKGYVNVFTDIDCGFCRRLHNQLPAMLAKGIEVRYLAFPRAGVSSKSAQKLATVWCSNEKQSLMDRFKRGENVPLQACDNNPVADQYMLGQQVGVNGTPAIVLESGRIIPGAVSPDFLAKEMGI